MIHYHIYNEHQRISVVDGPRAVDVHCASGVAYFYADCEPMHWLNLAERPQWPANISPVGVAVLCERRAQAVQFIFDWLEQQ